MLTITDAPRAFIVMRETATGRERVGMYPTEQAARDAIYRSNERHAPSRHIIWQAEWRMVGGIIDPPTDEEMAADAMSDAENDALDQIEADEAEINDIEGNQQ